MLSKDEEASSSLDMLMKKPKPPQSPKARRGKMEKHRDDMEMKSGKKKWAAALLSPMSPKRRQRMSMATALAMIPDQPSKQGGFVNLNDTDDDNSSENPAEKTPLRRGGKKIGSKAAALFLSSSNHDDDDEEEDPDQSNKGYSSDSGMKKRLLKMRSNRKARNGVDGSTHSRKKKGRNSSADDTDSNLDFLVNGGGSEHGSATGSIESAPSGNVRRNKRGSSIGGPKKKSQSISETGTNFHYTVGDEDSSTKGRPPPSPKARRNSGPGRKKRVMTKMDSVPVLTAKASPQQQVGIKPRRNSLGARAASAVTSLALVDNTPGDDERSVGSLKKKRPKKRASSKVRSSIQSTSDIEGAGSDDDDDDFDDDARSVKSAGALGKKKKGKKKKGGLTKAAATAKILDLETNLAKTEQRFETLQKSYVRMERRYMTEQQDHKVSRGEISELQEQFNELETQNETLKETLHQKQLKYDTIIALKDKEIKEMGHSLDLVLEMERSNPTGFDGKDGKLELAKEEIQKLKEQIEIMEESQRQMKIELQCHRDQDRNNVNNGDALILSRRENDDLKQKLDQKDDTIKYLMEQLQELKRDRGDGMDKSDHTASTHGSTNTGAVSPRRVANFLGLDLSGHAGSQPAAPRRGTKPKDVSEAPSSPGRLAAFLGLDRSTGHNPRERRERDRDSSSVAHTVGGFGGNSGGDRNIRRASVAASAFGTSNSNTYDDASFSPGNQGRYRNSSFVPQTASPRSGARANSGGNFANLASKFTPL